MTDIKEKIAWIWWKMRRFVSVFMFVCVCCESKTEKEEQNCEKLMMGDNRRESIVGKLPLESEVFF